jgi:hypothetical protein
MLFGVKQDLSEREIQLLDQYWNNKGRLYVLLHGSAKTPRSMHGSRLGSETSRRSNRCRRANHEPGDRSAWSQPVWDGAGKFSATAGEVLRRPQPDKPCVISARLPASRSIGVKPMCK